MDSKGYPQNSSWSMNGTEHKIGVLEQLSIVSVGSTTEPLDFQGQIDRWNRYQDLLDQIDEKCLRTHGDVRLKRNIKHNAKVLHDTEIAIMSTIGLVALLLVVGGVTTHGNYLIIVGSSLLAFVGWQVFIRIHPPSTIHFTCSPRIHIDEYAYMNRAIRGIPKVQRDPVVILPKIEMSLPRSWLAQQGMLEFMGRLEEVNSHMG